jgi:hypothetical protein
MSSQIKRVNPQLVAPIIWKAIQNDPALPASTTEAKTRLHIASWLCLAIYVDKQLIGCAAFENCKLHLAILPEWRGKWFCKRIALDIIRAGHERYAEIHATIPNYRADLRRAAEILKFKLYQEQPGQTVFSLKRA